MVLKTGNAKIIIITGYNIFSKSINKINGKVYFITDKNKKVIALKRFLIELWIKKISLLTTSRTKKKIRLRLYDVFASIQNKSIMKNENHKKFIWNIG